MTVPAAGARHRCVGNCLLGGRYLRVDDGDAGPSGLDFFPPGSRLHTRGSLGARTRPLACGRDPLARDIAPRLRVVACLARPRVGLQQRLVSVEIGLGVEQFRLGGRDVGFGGGDLRGSLPDVFGPRPGHQETKLCVGLGAVRAQPRDRQLGVPRVEPRDDLPRGDAVALGDRELEEAPSDFRGQLHVVGLDMARDADAVGRRVRATPGGEGENGEPSHAPAKVCSAAL